MSFAASKFTRLMRSNMVRKERASRGRQWWMLLGAASTVVKVVTCVQQDG